MLWVFAVACVYILIGWLTLGFALHVMSECFDEVDDVFFVFFLWWAYWVCVLNSRVPLFGQLLLRSWGVRDKEGK